MVNAFTANGLFGDLFRDATVADAFSGSAFLHKMIQFEAAWTRALIDVGAVTSASGDAALAAIAAFQADVRALGTGADRDGLPVPALVAALKAQAPEAAREAIHAGATSQDVIDTAMVLTCLDLLDEFAMRLRGISDSIGRLDARHGHNRLMARTRMQAALPVTVSDRLRLWRAPVMHRIDEIGALKKRIAVVQIGGPVGVRKVAAGQGDAIAARVAKTLGLTDAGIWHTDRAALADVGGWLVKTAVTLGKIGQDLSLMAQQGIDEVKITGAGGSSAMPHKQNPIHAETLVTLGRYVAGQQGVLGQALIHEQERSGVAWALEWLTLPAMFEATGAALNHAGHVLSRVQLLGHPDDRPGGGGT